MTEKLCSVQPIWDQLGLLLGRWMMWLRPVNKFMTSYHLRIWDTRMQHL